MSTPTVTLAAALREAAGILEQSGLHVDRDACQSYASNPEARMMQWAEAESGRRVALTFSPTSEEFRWEASAFEEGRWRPGGTSTPAYAWKSIAATRHEACRRLMHTLDGDRAAKEVAP